MSLRPENMQYPLRRHGMDHDRYAWSNLQDRPPLQWPGKAHIALWITPILQWFPLNMSGVPFLAPGGLTMPYPDYRHYTNRDYGNRVGIFRLFELLDLHKLPASIILNAAIAQRYPSLIHEITRRGFEVIAHGLSMGHLHHSGISREEESALVNSALDVIRRTVKTDVTGWLSPGHSQSWNTPDILVEQGINYCCDWANDDLPYEMLTRTKKILAMPLAYESGDRMILQEFKHTEDQWLQQTKDRFDMLYREAQRFGGRIMSLPLHAWIMGVPYRATYVREAIDYMLSKDGVWAATGQQIAEQFRTQAV
jgi:allantoinase